MEKRWNLKIGNTSEKIDFLNLNFVLEKEKIKVRQPLTRILVDGKYEELISDLTPLIMDELNVKEVVFEKQLDQYMNFSLKPNFKVAGPVFGGKIKDFGAALAAADAAGLVVLGLPQAARAKALAMIPKLAIRAIVIVVLS